MAAIMKPQDAKDFLYLFRHYMQFVANELSIQTDSFGWVNDIEDFLRVNEAMGADPGLIDEFIEKNRKSLNPQQIEDILPWKHAYDGIFSLTGYTKDGRAVLQTKIGNVCVTGIEKPISSFEMKLPAVIRTLLLPFRDYITYGTNIAPFPVAMGPGFLRLIENGKKKQRVEKPVVFIDKYVTYKEKAAAEEEEQFFHELERERKKAAGIEEIPEGMHKSIFLDEDVNDEELISKEFDKRAKNIDFNSLFKECDGLKPKHKLAEALSGLSKGELFHIAMHLLEDMPKNKKKQFYIDELVAFFSRAKEGGSEEHKQLLSYISLLGEADVNNLKKIAIDAKGTDEISLEQNLKTVLLSEPIHPLLFVYGNKKDKLISYVIPDEVEACLKNIDFEEASKRARLIDDIELLGKTAVEYYGLISLDSLIEEILDTLALSEKSNAARVMCFSALGFGTLKEDPFYTLDYVNDELYVMHPAIRPSSDEDSVVSSQEQLEDFSEYIMRDREGKERRPLKEIAGFWKVADEMQTRESGQMLLDWLNNHIPDGEDDFEFSFAVFDLLTQTATMAPSPTAIVNVLDEVGIAELCDEDTLRDVLNLLMRFANDTPRWDNYGYSPDSLIEKDTGRKIFYRKDGKIQKVGRNDPCPCGSGKKYKRCCGR